jgi:hypothetical protein
MKSRSGFENTSSQKHYNEHKLLILAVISLYLNPVYTCHMRVGMICILSHKISVHATLRRRVDEKCEGYANRIREKVRTSKETHVGLFPTSSQPLFVLILEYIIDF